MGKWKFVKLEPYNIQGLCVKCNEYPQRKDYRRKGEIGYRALCYKCEAEIWKCKETAKQRSIRAWAKRRLLIRPYTKYKKETCEDCGFIPIHTCQLDVHHIDGCHYNNDLNNLMTLCANCHRLKHLTPDSWSTGVF